jgi:hypothetical protein
MFGLRGQLSWITRPGVSRLSDLGRGTLAALRLAALRLAALRPVGNPGSLENAQGLSPLRADMSNLSGGSRFPSPILTSGRKDPLHRNAKQDRKERLHIVMRKTAAGDRKRLGVHLCQVLR